MHQNFGGRHLIQLIMLVPLLIGSLPAQQPGVNVTPPGAGAVQPVGQAANQDMEAVVNRLLKRIDELEASQKEMRAKVDSLTLAAQPPPVTPPAPTPSAVAGPPEPTQDDEAAIAALQQTDAANRNHTLGPVAFEGFTDFNFGRGWFEKLPPGGLVGAPNSFNIGDFDLFTNTRLSDKWNLVGELLVTSDFTNTFSVEMDRLLLTYKHNDYFSIGIGKFITALGYYPNESHRAQYFQTAIGRPIMYADEDNGGVLPVHSIGITSTGAIPGALGLHWVAEISNGTSLSYVEPIQNFADENNGKAVDFALYVKPERLRGFRAGFSVYRDTFHLGDIPAVRQYIYTGHIVYVGPRLEFLNEASLLHHEATDTREVFRSLVAYTQISYAFGKTRPFARYDYENVPERDPIFGTAGRSNGPSVGVNRRLSNFVIFKLQYGVLAQRGLRTGNDLNAQLAVAF